MAMWTLVQDTKSPFLQLSPGTCCTNATSTVLTADAWLRPKHVQLPYANEAKQTSTAAKHAPSAPM